MREWRMRNLIIVLGAVTGRTAEEFEANRKILRDASKELALKGWTPLNLGDMYYSWEDDERFVYETFMEFSTSIIVTCGSRGIPCCFVENWIFSDGARDDWDTCETFGVTKWESKDVPNASEWNGTDVTDAVITLLGERNQKGIASYGHRLIAEDGRDNERDIIEELSDALQYAVKEIVGLRRRLGA
jgi:hypothetical protein